MGYCVDMSLRGVTFKKEDAPKVVEILKEMNVGWMKNSDWCRFNSSMEDITEIFEDIGFELEDKDEHYEITEFIREKLGDHENIFIRLAPYLSDSEVAFFGEDDSDWKLVFKDGSHTRVEREEF